MKATIACLPCMIAQAYNTATRCTADEALLRAIMDETMRRYIGLPFNDSPAVLSQIAYETCRELSGVADPYKEEKRQANEAALALYPQLRQRLAQSAQPLYEALILAVAGNIIDLGLAQQYDLWRDVVARIEHGFDVAELEAFEEALSAARRILYLTDNAGEIVFDRLLMEIIGPERIIAVVKGGPIVNDALREDALQIGLDKLVRLIDTGTNYFGFPWQYVSETARREFLQADLVISKGHANYETVSELGDIANKCFYMLKVKCEQVAQALKVRPGSIVLLSHRTAQTRAQKI